MEDKTLTLIVSGALWRNSMIMMDEQTGSYWSHVTGKCLKGKLKGNELKTISSVHTTWADWYKEHPQTKVLKKSKEITSSHYEKYFTDPDRTGIFRANYIMNRMPGKTLVYGLSRGTNHLAITKEKVFLEKMIQTDLAKEKIIIYQSADKGIHAFINKYSFFKLSKKQNYYIDESTKSEWNFNTGKCINGKLKGKKLDEVSITAAFWFAWSSFFPNTKVID